MTSESKKQIFQRIQQVLHNERVSDADLVKALIEDGYSDLYLLALFLLFDPRLAQKVVITAISILVAKRRGYWGETPLVEWINRLVLEQCRRNRNGTVLPGLHAGFDEFTTSVGRSSEEAIFTSFLKNLQQLSEPQRAALLLRYGQNLTLDEIAGIMNTTAARCHIYLESTRQFCLGTPEFSDPYKMMHEIGGIRHTAILEQITEAADGLLDPLERSSLERHLAKCQSCRGKANQLAGGEKWLREQLPLLSGRLSSQISLGTIVPACQELVDRRMRWSRIRLSSQQYLYLGALVAFLVFIGLRFLRPVENPVVPSVQPTVTANTPTPDPWDGYFKFTYYTSPEDSLEILADRLGVTVEALTQLNQIRNDAQIHPGRELTLAVEESTFAPLSPLPALTLPAKLTAQADEATILERMAKTEELVGTLWGDYRFILYGPPGYSGPPFLESRMQVWWHQDGHMVIVAGETVASTNEVLAQYSIPSGFTLNVDRSNGSYNGYLHQGEPGLYYFLDPTLLIGLEQGKASLKVAGSDNILGRPALVVDWLQGEGLYSARLWIDVERGLVLRLRLFDDDSMQVALMDLGFRDLELDLDLPVGIFSPISFKPVGFAVDFTGRPLADGAATHTSPWALPPDRRPRELIPAPDGFDSALEPLTLQWPNEAIVSAETEVGVFAGEYYMGSIDIGQGAVSPDQGDFYASIPFNSCIRSPDGRLVAVSISRLSSFESRIYWFRLANPGDLKYVLSTMDSISEFAFDPTSRFLAYYGCTSGLCGINILDTNTNTNRFLYQIRYGLSSLTWSPDGNYLAFLGSDQRSNTRKIYVIRASSGQSVYEAEYSWDARSVPSDSPTLYWGVQFPAGESFFPFVEGCRYPFEYPQWANNDRLD